MVSWKYGTLLHAHHTSSSTPTKITTSEYIGKAVSGKVVLVRTKVNGLYPGHMKGGGTPSKYPIETETH